MHLQCPHCHNPIELVEPHPAEEIVCASCGSTFRVEPRAPSTRAGDGKDTLGRFELINAVGQGAFGTVYVDDVSPDGDLEFLRHGKQILLKDRRWKPHLPSLFQPDPYWHRDQLTLAEKENHSFAAAFRQSRLAGFEPWDASLRLTEADAWAKAGQPERAARAFLQAVLLDPRIGARPR